MAKRIHLYRAQKIDSPDFVEGNLIEVLKDSDGNPFTAILEKERTDRFEYPYLNASLGVIDGEVIPVKPETVAEYTEVDDKDGKKVWEWCECKITDSFHNETVGYIAKVQGCFVFVEYETKNILKLCDLPVMRYTIEVVADWFGKSLINEIKGDAENE